jgi:transcriptional regulator with XRE-family HTH domain
VPSNGDLGRAIRRLRHARKLTIEDLAHAADMHPTYAGRIERGGASPTFEKIVHLARALDVSLPVLMYRVEDEAEVTRAMRETRARIARNR